ncbi:MAG: hypothetical protein DI538_23570 [Azospira oryzae]|jgi:intracellular sulfur oxidation DsrE/DsrF family protein|nr:MAG: hypothetical protein DI538_23570 [Azospira oryzae]
MKTRHILVVLLLITLAAKAQQPANTVLDNKVHKMVMQFTSADSAEQATVVAQVRNIRTVWPKAEIEVVCQGGGLELLVASKSKAAKAVAEWSAKGVVFAACNNSMRRQNVKKEELLPSAIIVPSALVELVQKQETGWAYLKAAH